MSPPGAFQGWLGFDLLRPEMLAWLAAALALAAAGWHGLGVRRRGRRLFVSERHMGRFLPGFSEGRARLRVVLAAAAAALLALSLAGPVRGYTVREVRRRGLDLVVCIDTSRSMLVRDLRPDRLTRAVREVRGLIDRLRGDRVALIAFSGDVREVAPLTHDRSTLIALLERVGPEDNLRGGTDLGAALQRALALFDGRTGAHEAIVLVTDGEDLEGHGLEMARAAAERGIRVYVVGMGTEAGGKIPVRTQDGAERFVQDGSGEEVISRLESGTLERIAQTTGGAYIAASRSPTPLEEIHHKRISLLEGRETGGGKEWVPHDRFQWAAALALFSMLVESGLRERVRRRDRRPAAPAATERAEGGAALRAPARGAGPAARARELAEQSAEVPA